MTTTCAPCGGTGQVTCGEGEGACGGRGYQMVSYDGGCSYERKTCDACQGTGRVTCPACAGEPR
jgi:hypothetical protein